MILCSQIAFRHRLKPEQVQALKFPLPGGVLTASIGVVFLLFIIGLIGYFPTTRASLYVGAVWILLLLLGYRRVKTKRVAAS
ncbi:Proline-specific permease ProY [Sodalis glossinidius str. 'morsitans']|uniref:Proline-specific permease ProY n=1 Tax=Sodalis glossinidius (strain morsitans) TaxID=343509 RepID=A0A193QGS6_SODGM|nr:Proline-specific permease ProY [Sodalis glossinidius str. 'morsitans']